MCGQGGGSADPAENEGEAINQEQLPRSEAQAST